MLRIPLAGLCAFLPCPPYSAPPVGQVKEGENGHSQQYGYDSQLSNRFEHGIILSRKSLLSDERAMTPRAGAVLLEGKEQNRCQENKGEGCTDKVAFPVQEFGQGRDRFPGSFAKKRVPASGKSDAQVPIEAPLRNLRSPKSRSPVSGSPSSSSRENRSAGDVA